MKKVRYIILVLGFIYASPAFAGGVQILPKAITLTGPQAGQRLIVLVEEGGQYVGDRTSQATFTSSNPAVATINEAGFVKAVGDGEAVFTANFEDKQAIAKIKVEKTQAPVERSFRNDLIPMMTKIG